MSCMELLAEGGWLETEDAGAGAQQSNVPQLLTLFTRIVNSQLR